MLERNHVERQGDRPHDELKAILEEHLPPDIQKQVWGKIDEISANHFDMADYDQLIIYRALLGHIPQHQQEIRAAFQPVVFNGSMCDDADWRRWEGQVEWPLTPDYWALLTGEQRERRGKTHKAKRRASTSTHLQLMDGPPES